MGLKPDDSSSHDGAIVLPNGAGKGTLEPHVLLGDRKNGSVV